MDLLVIGCCGMSQQRTNIRILERARVSCTLRLDQRSLACIRMVINTLDSGWAVGLEQRGLEQCFWVLECQCVLQERKRRERKHEVQSNGQQVQEKDSAAYSERVTDEFVYIIVPRPYPSIVLDVM